MDDKYIVLTSRQSMTGDPFARVFPAMAGRPSLAFDVAFEVRDLKKKEVAELARNPEVVASAPVMPMKLIAPQRAANQELVDVANQQTAWGVQAVGADSSPFDGDGIVVAVIDTGIDAGHAAFNGIDLLQQDFTGEGDGDEHGHGTHCAGTIFGRDVNGTRIGVARGVKKALIGKVLGRDGGGSSEQICSAILWAVENGANVVSMSLGIDFPGYQKELERRGLPPEVATSRALEGYRRNVEFFEALAAHVQARSLFSQTALIVAAAGNESNRKQGEFWEVSVSPPAVSQGIVSVAAIQTGAQGFTVASFSNTGANLSGPGVNVVSAQAGGGLVAFNGTSMATPHVAGVAATWAQKLKAEGRLNAIDLTARLIGSTVTEGFKQGFDPLDVGAGLVRCPQQ
ncbi:MAG TPA: S8 family serine peptidase [Paucimonas sp.]|nr:S8 family serine peptidase [Paucimonas sp.]